MKNINRSGSRASSTREKISYISSSAIIAALYVALTWMSNIFGLASGAIQCRLSEALCILPFFTPAAIPGVTIGCLLANLLTTGNIYDIIFGTLASFIGVLGGYFLRKYRYLVSIPTILANTLIIPFVLKFMFGLKGSIWYFFVTVGIGEVISAGVFGTILLLSLDKINKNKRLF